MFSARVLVILLVFVAFIVPVRAEDGDVQAQYDAMVARSYDMPQGYDFAKLRALYQKLPTYDPYTLNAKVNYYKLKKKRVEMPEQTSVLEQDYLMKHFAIPEAHVYGIALAKVSKDQKREDYHSWMFEGLYKALINSGNGANAENAFKVLSVREEYYLLEPFMKKYGRTQTLKHIDGGHYDVIEGEDSKTGKPIDYWFDITHIYGTATKE